MGENGVRIGRGIALSPARARPDGGAAHLLTCVASCDVARRENKLPDSTSSWRRISGAEAACVGSGRSRSNWASLQPTHSRTSLASISSLKADGRCEAHARSVRATNWRPSSASESTSSSSMSRSGRSQDDHARTHTRRPGRHVDVGVRAGPSAAGPGRWAPAGHSNPYEVGGPQSSLRLSMEQRRSGLPATSNSASRQPQALR